MTGGFQGRMTRGRGWLGKSAGIGGPVCVVSVCVCVCVCVCGCVW